VGVREDGGGSGCSGRVVIPLGTPAGACLTRADVAGFIGASPRMALLPCGRVSTTRNQESVLDERAGRHRLTRPSPGDFARPAPLLVGDPAVTS